MSETTKATTPYFAINRDDESDFYEEGFRDAYHGRNKNPPTGKRSKIDSYDMGYLAGQMVSRLRESDD